MKILKLFFIALLFIGGFWAISQCSDSKKGIESPTFTSENANQWKQKIEELCNSKNWTVEAYENIESGIHSDRVHSDGELITMDEEISLKKYLYALSCSFINEETDDLFKQKVYAPAKIKAVKTTLGFLNNQTSSSGENSNLKQATNLYNEYKIIMGCLSFRKRAYYSHPLEAYPGGSAKGKQSRIESLAHYKSHFSNNKEIVSKVENLEELLNNVEKKYYMDLEKCIEDNYNKNKSLETLLDDQIRFDEISTNKSAISSLENFIQNN